MPSSLNSGSSLKSALATMQIAFFLGGNYLFQVGFVSRSQYTESITYMYGYIREYKYRIFAASTFKYCLQFFRAYKAETILYLQKIICSFQFNLSPTKIPRNFVYMLLPGNFGPI